MDKFIRIKNFHEDIYELLLEAENNSESDSQLALIKSKKAIELFTLYVAEKEDLLDLSSITQLHVNLRQANIFTDEIYSLFHRSIMSGISSATLTGVSSVEQIFMAIEKIIEWYIDRYYTTSPIIVRNEFDNYFQLPGFSVFEDKDDLDIYQKDVFETDEDYTERVSKLAPIEIGVVEIKANYKNSLNEVLMLEYQFEVNPTFSLPEISNLFIRATDNLHYKLNKQYPLFATIIYFDNELFININKMFIKTDSAQFNIDVIIAKSSYVPYETAEETTVRLANLQKLPKGKAQLLKDKYDITTNIFPVEVAFFSWVGSSNIIAHILVDKIEAKALYNQEKVFDVFGDIDTGLFLHSTHLNNKFDILYSASKKLDFTFTIVNIDDKWGLLDEYNNEIIKAEYDQIEDLGEGIYAVKLKNKWGLVNNIGVAITPLQYNLIKPFTNGRAVAVFGDKFIFIDTAGKEISTQTYDYITHTDTNYIRVKKDNKWGVIDLNEDTIIPFKYDEIEDFNDGIAKARKKFKWGKVFLDGHEEFSGFFW
ncbi:MAG: hypothetical protein BEN19_05190 [Epulopiscium sp. Nuni2H_MBin003]|nr:MAG: hypothetical protein BEN19_05190 [Epulopiscium sp. Nuni2H_MBin003]